MWHRGRERERGGKPCIWERVGTEPVTEPVSYLWLICVFRWFGIGQYVAPWNNYRPYEKEKLAVFSAPAHRSSVYLLLYNCSWRSSCLCLFRDSHKSSLMNIQRWEHLLHKGLAERRYTFEWQPLNRPSPPKPCLFQIPSGHRLAASSITI